MPHATRTIGAGIILALVLLAASLTSIPAQAALSPPKSAADFTNSVGVNTHARDFSTSYGDWSQTIASVNYLGVKHLRDNAFLGQECAAGTDYSGDGCPTNSLYTNRYQRMTTETGARFQLIMDWRTEGAVKKEDTQEVANAKIGQILRLGGGSIEALEGPNENNAPSADIMVPYIQKVSQAIDANDSSITYAGPSFTERAAYQKNGDLSTWIDASNIHSYTSGREPETTGFGPNASTGYGSLDYNLTNAHIQSATDPVYATETGYHNTYLNEPVTAQKGVPESVSGVYAPREALYYFSHGVERTYFYELLNRGPNPDKTESNYGLFRSDYTPKPAATALQRTMTLLADTGTGSLPPALDYQLTGQTQDIHTVLIGKHNGSYHLAMWNERPIYDPVTDTSLTVPAQSVTVSLPRSFGSLTLRDVGTTTTAGSWQNKSSVTFNANSRVRILAFK